MERQSPSDSRQSDPGRAFRLLVVDDEPMIARGIQSMLRRMGHPAVGDVQTAFSGADAISRIAARAPDIVILDIRMPGLTGLDVLERCHERCPDTHFFVLSGHDEFEYVKQAFKLGALDYLLKPASMTDLKELLRTAASRVADGRKSALADDVTGRWSLQMEIERSLDAGDETTIRRAIDDTPASLLLAWFRISIVRTPRSSPEGALSMRKLIGPRIWEISRGAPARAYFFWTPDSDLGLFWNLESRDAMGPMRELWSQFPPAVRDAPGAFMSVSAAVSADTAIGTIYDEASVLLLYRFVPDAPKLLSAASAREAYGAPPFVDTSDAFAAARSGDAEAIVAGAEEIFADSPRSHGAALRSAYASLLAALSAYCDRHGSPTPTARSIAELDTAADVRDEIRSLVNSARAAAASPPAGQDSVGYAVEYVDGHLHEDLDMARVAAEVGLSYSHFSRLFKERTGEGFGHYLLRRRMNRARQMLGSPTVRISEVAYAVGYRSHKHFSRAFREFYGRTPSEFRGS